MKKCDLFSTAAIKSMVSFCKKFPETLTRLGYKDYFCFSMHDCRGAVI